MLQAVATALIFAAFPAPFSRPLKVSDPPLRGADVTVLQQLLRRAPGKCALACGCGCSHRYDQVTANAVACYLNRTDGTLDEAGAHKVLSHLSDDRYVDDGMPANATGHLYKLLIPVHRNRSIETTATLLDAHNTKLLSFRVRAHGHDVDSSGVPVPGRPWPDFHDDDCPESAATAGCVGLNQFSPDGSTPTGLSEVDLNTPESSSKFYGPYPVNRFVRGLQGNAEFLFGPAICDSKADLEPTPIRSGILMHTGEWANHSRWTPGQPMPNSAGCVHAYPDAIHTIWRMLVARGVVARPNTDGKLPYPFRPQGIASVYVVP